MNAPATLPEAPCAVSDEDRARADHYALVARLFFAAPDAALLAVLADTGRVLGGDDAPLARAWAAVGEAAARHDPADLRDEYAGLFHSVSRAEVMPYGSFWLAGFLMEEPLAHLREDLARLGLARREGVGEPEDHIAALAEVMRHLVLAGGGAAGLARQREFFARHLQPWYGRFADALAAAPQADFYRRVGELARAFFDIEGEAFEMA